MESWAVEECLAHADTRAVLAALRKEWADKEAELLAELAKRGVELEEAKSAIDQARYPLHSPATTGGLGSAHPDPDTHLCPAPAIQLVSQLEAEEEKNRQERERTRRATLQAAHEAELRREVEQSRWKSPRTAPGATGAHRWPQGRPRRPLRTPERRPSRVDARRALQSSPEPAPEMVGSHVAPPPGRAADVAGAAAGPARPRGGRGAPRAGDGDRARARRGGAPRGVLAPPAHAPARPPGFAPGSRFRRHSNEAPAGPRRPAPGRVGRRWRRRGRRSSSCARSCRRRPSAPPPPPPRARPASSASASGPRRSRRTRRACATRARGCWRTRCTGWASRRATPPSSWAGTCTS